MALMAVPKPEALILTPKPPAAPLLSGPKVYGCRPGIHSSTAFPATGERPMQFAAEDLPAGLQLDTRRRHRHRRRTGAGTYTVTLHAEELPTVTRSRTLKIVSGDTLALTPPMGWNHWYAHYNRITDTTHPRRRPTRWSPAAWPTPATST